MRFAWALLVAAFLSGWEAYSSVARLNLPAPTIEGGVPGVATTSRSALVVVIDGLGADAAAALPALATVPGSAWVKLEAEPPTFSSAQYVAFLTGVGPVDSGVRTNLLPSRSGRSRARPVLNPRQLTLDTVTARVRAGGGRAVVVSDEVDWWSRLFTWDEALRVAPGQLMAEAERLIDDRRNQLVLVHLTGVDQAGHAAGAASAAYQRASVDAAAQATALVTRWGGRGPVLVLSDHGHMPRGGHGGSEAAVRDAFLVMAGPGVRAGARTSASTTSVAPTLAALLGVPAPAQALGRTLFEALDLGRDEPVIAQAEARRRSVVIPVAAAEREALAAAEWRAGLLRAVMAGLLVGAAAWWLRRLGAPAARGLVHGAAATLLLAALIALVAGRISFSAFRSLKVQAIELGLLSLAAGLLALAMPLRAAWRGLSLARARALAAGVAVGAAPPALAAFVVTGLRAPRFSCRPDWLAAGPTMAWLGLGPILACAALLVLLAALRSER